MAKFQKGKSGNPGGRPKKAAEHYEVEAAARGLSLEAIDTLAKWMRYKKDPMVSVKACFGLLDRAFGKAAQEVRHKGTVTHELENFADAQLAAIVARGIARNRGGDAGGADRAEAPSGKNKPH